MTLSLELPNSTRVSFIHIDVHSHIIVHTYSSLTNACECARACLCVCHASLPAYDYAQRLHIGQAAVEDMMNAAISSFTGHSSVVFSQCELANISVCAPAQSTDHVTVIVFYNPLVRKRTEVVTVPINVDTVTVTDDTNTPLPSQVIQLLPLASFTADSAPYAVQFAIDVSPLGYGTYFITPSSSIQLEQISKNDKPSAPHKKKASSNAHASKFAPLRPVPEPATPTDYTTISNEYLTINFDSTSGNIVSVVDKITGHTTSFTQRWGYYESYTSTSGDQQSGAYIFRPRIQAVIPVAVNASQFFVSGANEHEAMPHAIECCVYALIACHVCTYVVCRCPPVQ